jgi:hypothetical protein
MKTKHLAVTGLFVIAGTFTLLSGNFINRKSAEQKIAGEPKITPVEKAEILPVQPVKNNPGVAVQPKTLEKQPPKGCVFKTSFEGEGLDQGFYYKIPGRVMSSINGGLDWLVEAQHPDGGWGAGYHSKQQVRDPHAVKTDPATTAMVAMAIQRRGNSLKQGKYSRQLRDALEYLLEAVETSDEQSLNITKLTGTQIQSKLGANIDVALTSQFLSNMVTDLDYDPQLKRRVKKAIQVCVDKIEGGQTANGSQKGSGWAGVLQSSFASSALETAQTVGVEVDEEALERSRDYQKGNINPTTNDVVTESAAGIVLYSVSGSTRASAKETAEAKELVKKAKAEGKIKNEEVTVDNLRKAGVSESKALKYSTAYKVNQSAKRLAQDENVMTGFGNNGGEEFLSYLQTGEGMIMSRDDDWKSWYDKMSGRLLKIQNNDGSWSGHHCITSPVFCTATCLLILSVNNDIDKLTMK